MRASNPFGEMTDRVAEEFARSTLNRLLGARVTHLLTTWVQSLSPLHADQNTSA
jgi:hypothetical protein